MRPQATSVLAQPNQALGRLWLFNAREGEKGIES